VRARRSLWLAVVVAVLASGCGLAGGASGPAHVDLRGSRAGLVSAFNADRGKLRAVFIASPT
jgi:hypothetical protein